MTSVLTTDLLESLLENLPPETEARALRALQLEPSVLVPPERFCWEMAKMPRLRNMLQARSSACAAHAPRCMRGAFTHIPCIYHAYAMQMPRTCHAHAHAVHMLCLDHGCVPCCRR